MLNDDKGVLEDAKLKYLKMPIFVNTRVRNKQGFINYQSTDLKPDANRQPCKLGNSYYKLMACYVGPGTS